MNFLIIDDDEHKVALVSELLRDCGVPTASIFSATDAVSARKLLAERDFGIVFLDVLLPARVGRRPAGDVSADLLREMYEEGTLRNPDYVIGITADFDARHNYGDEFGEFASAIVHVQSGNDAWKEPLRRAVKARMARASADRVYDFDVCVQTALGHPELSSFVAASGVDWKREERVSTGVWARFGEIRVSGRTLSIACAHAPSMGMVAATSLAEKLITKLAPRYLLMTGFCGGIGSELSLGDLVVADKAWDWQSGKYANGEFVSGVDQKDGCPDLIAAARKVARNTEVMKGVGASNVHVAPMVSGSSIIADPKMHERLKDQHRKVAAVDMEAYGLYYAASYSRPKSSVLCVKGVADLADSTKSDDIQRICSEASARFAMELIRTVS